ncbi:TPA: hypothetical protein JBG74_07430 [Legionella pneumophila]|uniref:Uncharacterized protein n=1 Tax=Legionella pneumophila TaxID=446 RepID=A0AAN5TAJ2_LEGPN|nr:hypothetical protein A6J41_012290 [Legionella pneumophila subsp. pneumophila]PPK34285.1 hypothetical protein C3927_04045 [Legionella pneumophila]QDD17118.1 hypothetical protein FIU05_15415 [Legionella pneumophila]RDE56983.1 hypothetical protein DV939_04580 [Legionella pneumophila]RDE57153.1 hypothetical protein DV514_04825 [Legionella pneumophila]
MFRTPVIYYQCSISMVKFPIFQVASLENFVIKFTYRPIDNLLLRRKGFCVNFVLGLYGTI